MKSYEKGSIALILVAIVALTLVGGGAYYAARNISPSQLGDLESDTGLANETFINSLSPKIKEENILPQNTPPKETAVAPSPTPKMTTMDSFALCIKDRGALFYGAFWCPHCQAQKKLFGNSAHLLPYVECSTPDGTGQTPACTSQGITQYPTWTFKNGGRQSGELSLETLSKNTGCLLPR